MVAGAARRPPAVIGAAGVGGGQVAAAHGKHRASAVTALEEAGVDVVVLLDAAVVGAGAAFAQRARGGKGAVVNDGLVVVFDDDMLAFVPRHVLAVDLDAGGLALTECADIEVIVEDALHGHDRPRALGRAAGFLTGGFPAHLLGHARRGDALRGQKIGDFLVPPAIVVVVVKDAAHDVRFGRHHFKFLALVDGVAIGRGADPFSVHLPPSNDVSHLFAGIGDGHFVDQKLELDFQPVVVVGEVDAVADGDDTHAGVAQVLQLHQAAAVAAGETREILDEQDVILVGHQATAHLLIALALLKGVAGAVAVLKEGEAAARKALLHKVADDGLLVFDGDVIPVQLIVHGDARITGDVEGFDHGGLPPFVGVSLRLGTLRTTAGECALPLWGCFLSMGILSVSVIVLEIDFYR